MHVHGARIVVTGATGVLGGKIATALAWNTSASTLQRRRRLRSRPPTSTAVPISSALPPRGWVGSMVWSSPTVLRFSAMRAMSTMTAPPPR